MSGILLAQVHNTFESTHKPTDEIDQLGCPDFALGQTHIIWVALLVLSIPSQKQTHQHFLLQRGSTPWMTSGMELGKGSTRQHSVMQAPPRGQCTRRVSLLNRRCSTVSDPVRL